MDSKPFWASRTLWVNFLAILGTIGASVGLNLPGDLQAEIVVAAMALANIVLRFVTTQAVSATGTGTG